MEPLSDPLLDRPVKSHPAPPHKPLDHRILFPDNLKQGSLEVPDWKTLKAHVLSEGRISKVDAIQLARQAGDVMMKEPNVLQVQEPVVVVGDIHGQFYDLMHMLDKIGDPTSINYVFLGDYVDRGIYSVECLILLFALKCAHPTNIFLMRGNHESRSMTEYFTFREETLEKYDQEVYDNFVSAFDTMPLVAVVNQEYLCMHGGVSPNMKSL